MAIRILETPRRLSESILWTWQRRFFETRGMEAWTSGTVPHHITNSPAMAEAYIQILFAFLCDSPCDPSQPFYIVELGSGPGRLGYLILSGLLEKLARYPIDGVRVKYVLTDFARRNIDYWRNHGWLQTFIEAGTLDIAQLDAEKDDALHLEISGEVLASGSLKNPLAVIANYVFDSIPQDAFHIERGTISATLIGVSSSQRESDLTNPEIISRASLQYRFEAIAGNCYDDQEWNRMLSEYVRRLPVADILFPSAALRCVSALDRFSSGRLILLSADRGYSSDADLLERKGPPKISRHGSFSMPVDYQLMGDYFLRRGGLALHPERSNKNLNVSVFLLGNSVPPDNFTHTRTAYDQAVRTFGPDDLFTLKTGIQRSLPSLTLEQMIAFLRLNRWDYLRFWHCLPFLRKRIQKSTEANKRALSDAIQNVWKSYFPIGENEDLAFQMGSLLLEMESYAEAVEFFHHSTGLYGEEYGSALNMARCYCGLHRMDLAQEWVDRALEFCPDSDVARSLSLEMKNAGGTTNAVQAVSTQST